MKYIFHENPKKKRTVVKLLLLLIVDRMKGKQRD